MTVGFHSPLPPSRTGVADYSSALLAALARRGDVRTGAERAEVHLYHAGNNGMHREIYRLAIRQPGVVVLHDALLNHLLLGTMSRDEYADEFVYNYGEWMRTHAVELWQRRARSGTDPEYFRYPMLKRLAGSALAVVVHNPAAARTVRAHAPNVKVVIIPHLFSPGPAPDSGEVQSARAEWGAGSRSVIFGVFGHLRETKRVAEILRAFERIRDRASGPRLVLAGEPVSETYGRAIDGLAARAGAVRLPYQTEREFWRNAAATDVCVNLRYPAAGETSGIAIRMMGTGRCVLLTAGEETSDLPESACVRVDPGLAEQGMLETLMAWLAEDRDAARQIGVRAAAHIREHHSLDRVSELYWQVLTDARS